MDPGLFLSSLFFCFQRSHHINRPVLPGDHQSDDQGNPEGQQDGEQVGCRTQRLA